MAGWTLAALACALTACAEAGNAGEAAAPAEAAALGEVAPAPGIVLDQFGYRPGDAKIVRLREPVTGFDAAAKPQTAGSFEGFEVRRATSNELVQTLTSADTGADVPVDPLSGDRVRALDISSITAPGDYVITPRDGGQIWGEFTVGKDVYRPILREAFRTFYYQRAGFAKSAPFVGEGWSDGASHLGPRQDGEARLYSATGDASTARDLRGGWFDAGDYNQYTNWTADYCLTLLMSYAENPGAWGDDFGIPESGNGISDLLDEATWGLDWLLRMQRPDGGVLSVLARDTASPPSAARGPSRYGPASTSATLSAAGTFAFAAMIYAASDAPGHAAYAARLKAAALAASAWAEANPAAVFSNNDKINGSEGLGAGQQEADAEYLNGKKFAAAAYLSVLTGEARFLPVMDAALAETALMQSRLADAYRYEVQDAALFLARQPGAPPELRAHLAGIFTQRLSPDAAPGYGVPVDALHWGSNGVMARTGTLYLEASRLAGTDDDARKYASRALDYLHYLHGANPMGKAYLTSMGAFGAEASVTAFYRSWTTPALIPGFLVGGPNPLYDWDACCPETCGNAPSNAACGAARPSPPYGQPPLKSYRDFDDGWPLNSWQISENSNGYQVAYLRLIANFVE